MVWLLTLVFAVAGEPWHTVPEGIAAAFDAPELPWLSPSPTGEHVLQLTPRGYPSLEELAAPMLKLAGTRLNPATGGLHGAAGLDAASVVALRGGAVEIRVPAGLRLLDVDWAPDGEHLVLEVAHPDHIGLWFADLRGQLTEARGVALVEAVGGAWSWLPDGGVLVKRAPDGRVGPPQASRVPPGPLVRDSAGGATAASTYEARDLLVTPADDALFTWYATSQLARVRWDGSVDDVGEPGVYASAVASPDGRFLLVRRLSPPWSHRVVWSQFAGQTELWDAAGARVSTLESHLAQDAIPIHGVPTGPRSISWRPSAPATLTWLEALDGGDPGAPADLRDRFVSCAAPCTAPQTVFEAAHRIQGVNYGADGLAVITQHERERRWRHVWTLQLDVPGSARPWFDLSSKDAYNDPGSLVSITRPDGTVVLMQDQGALFFAGDGATPEGDRPFLDRRAPGAAVAERLFRSEASGYAAFVAFAGNDPRRFFLTRESPTQPPELRLATLKGPTRAVAGEAAYARAERPLIRVEDPQPELRGIQKQIVRYTREDGVPLSFTLYLPPGYTAGDRLPTVLYAYPREYSDPETAGQVTASASRFTRIRGPGVLWFLLAGYAVLADTAMPVVGDPDTAYDTFVEQIVMDAEAAVAEAVRRGVTDPSRVGVMGHSHGALMVATLLAHSDLFQAGIARSGAYNHTIRPFGFQNERRTLWEATDTYLEMSPVMFAPQINEPLLIVHGADDQNPGTVPLQSERLFESVRGVGGQVRLVMLPFEGHGYLARESVEHVLWEQISWFDHHVKQAQPGDAPRN
jgi:dipeptidyl aminopeptidase/acylaminoacyl peptidase